MSTDNRTIINDCEANTGWAGDDTATVDSDAGQFYQGSNSLSTQLSNTNEHMYTTQDSVGATTFSLDWSDSTLYMLIKDNLPQSFANGGIQFVIGDGTDRTGYDIGGTDARGMSLSSYYFSLRLDVSVVVAAPGTFTNFAGTEANLDQTAITQIGYGAIHQAKANGPSDNAWMDGFRYIANDSYALTINGGTVGTPETMVDVAGDDVTNGWGMVSNPLGSQYLFGAPTEWGESGATADHYFTATDEQWYWLGDNGGGHAIGATHFPFRLISNATDTGSFVLTRVAIVNTGTRVQLLMDDANFDIIELDGCSLSGLDTISLPSSGGTSRFTTNCTFTDCAQITNNGADMTGSKVLESNVAADEGALLYNEATDPDGELDNITFSQGTAAHHAFTFGADIPSAITIRGADFSGFSSSADNDGSVFEFLDTTGTITLNLVGCSHDGSGFTVDTRAGCTVNVVIDPVTTLVNVKDEQSPPVNLQNARVYLRASDNTALPFEETVTIARVTTVATVTHTAHGMESGDKVSLKGITNTLNSKDNNGVKTITFIDANSYSYATLDEGDASYTGTITSTWVALEELTDVSGNASLSRTHTADQPVTGWVRMSTSSPRYKSFPIAGTIDTTDGLTINVQMIRDE